MPNAAAIYARISSDREGTQAGTRRQLADCRNLADARKWPVIGEYVDDDTSAFSGTRRPQYRQLLADIEAGEVDAVVVWHLDRLHRQPRELEEFVDVCDQAKLTHVATVAGDVDLATDDGLLIARLSSAIANKESRQKSRRIARKHDELAADGKPSGGGARPYGFEDNKITVRESEAAVIREVAARLLGGDSMGSICRDLEDRGLRSSTGKAWKVSGLRRIMMTGRISGQREHHGEIVGPAVWPAIITPDQTTRLRALFNDPSRKATRAPRSYVLSGMLRCGRCASTMVSRPRPGGVRAYVCNGDPGTGGCGRMYVTADGVEALVVEAVLYRLDTPELAATLARGVEHADGAATQAAHDEDTAQLEELAQAYANKAIQLAEWLTARKIIEDRIKINRRKLSRMTGTTVLDGFIGDSDQLRQLWADLTLSRQQAIVKAVVDHLVVSSSPNHGNTFDPDRINPIWKL